MSNRPQLLSKMGTGIGDNKTAAKPNVVTPEKSPIPGKTTPEKDTSPKRTPVSDVLKMRKEIMRAAKSGKASMEAVKAKLENSGINDPLAIETILSTRLNDNVIKYFLGATKNNPKKAKALAKKFGFEV